MSGPAPAPSASTHLPDLVFTGGCEAQLVRAVVPYRGIEERGLPGGHSADLGVGVVVEGPTQGRIEVLDLGSGERRMAEVKLPLIVFGWLFSTPFQDLLAWSHARSAGVEGTPSQAGAPGAACSVLSRIGYSTLTRGVFLRAAFRDLALDLDPHEGTAVRLALPGSGVARVHLEYERGVLVFRTGRSTVDPTLLPALTDAFPSLPIFRVVSGAGQGTAEMHVHLPELPGLDDLREEMRRVRRGLMHLLARFDEARYRTVTRTVAGFGERDLLAGVQVGRADREDALEPGGLAGIVSRERVFVPRPSAHPGRVH
ncbi:MAG: hypothetical protein EA350_12705 [Gemmatimonadales bacterium]|nr:MAG: hypothetical protein EA350_12705 [Gemmatimonadales bacterium]